MTGVQTCALPIFSVWFPEAKRKVLIPKFELSRFLSGNVKISRMLVNADFVHTIINHISTYDNKALDVKKKARSSETLKDVEKGVQEKSKEMLEILQPLLIQINKGLVVEREHTDDPAVAFKITMDHLKESLTYYDDLEKYVEKKPQVSTDKEKPSKTHSSTPSRRRSQ